MREIKFRGQSIDSKEWIYGDILQVPTKGWCSIMQHTASAFNFPVIPSTIGQFTGLFDKNGKEIYEGDIIVFRNVYSACDHIGKVRYYADCKPISEFDHHSIDLAETNSKDLEVIGNIHEVQNER